MASAERSLEHASGADGTFAGGTPPANRASSRGTFWLNGEVLACACPECGSPMSIRLWLMLADCWRCHTSIELTEEQELEALQLLESHGLIEPTAEPVAPEEPVAPVEPSKPEVVQPEPPPAPVPVARVAPKPQTPPKPTAAPKSIVVPKPAPATASAPPPPKGKRLAAEKPGRVRSQLQEIGTVGELSYWLKHSWRSLPAWLISLLFHMALLILLATVFMSEEEPKPRAMVLSTRADDSNIEGDFENEIQPDPIEFFDAGAPDPTTEIVPEPIAASDPFESPLKPGDVLGDVDNSFIPEVGAPGGGGSIFSGRAPAARARLALEDGGTIESEAAVTRGLEWLVRHQNSDGSWSLDGRFANPGGHSDTAATAMALLPFLGAGQTHLHGNYRKTVKGGIDWLVKNQVHSNDPRTNGSLMGQGIGRMYAHGQAAIALCEAFALTQDSKLRAPAQLAIDFIVRAQHSQGGWRYTPGEAGDTSVVGWQIMALRSAQMAYLKVPQEVFDKANLFLDKVQADSVGSEYSYTPNSRASHAMTAEGLLCRQYGGWPANHPALLKGSSKLLKENLPSQSDSNIYYWYYATQVMHHIGGDYWETWNNRLRDLLIETQVKQGPEAGSWDPVAGRDSHARHSASSGGRLFQTALSICTLEVYYRHMPLYRSVAAD